MKSKMKITSLLKVFAFGFLVVAVLALVATSRPALAADEGAADGDRAPASTGGAQAKNADPNIDRRRIRSSYAGMEAGFKKQVDINGNSTCQFCPDPQVDGDIGENKMLCPDQSSVNSGALCPSGGGSSTPGSAGSGVKDK